MYDVMCDLVCDVWWVGCVVVCDVEAVWWGGMWRVYGCAIGCC